MECDSTKLLRKLKAQSYLNNLKTLKEVLLQNRYRQPITFLNGISFPPEPFIPQPDILLSSFHTETPGIV